MIPGVSAGHGAAGQLRCQVFHSEHLNPHPGGTMRTVLYSIAVGAVIGAMLTEIYLAAVR